MTGSSELSKEMGTLLVVNHRSSYESYTQETEPNSSKNGNKNIQSISNSERRHSESPESEGLGQG
jgi:hypothetical protein